MREIPLTRGLVAVVDDEDYELIAAHKWHAREARGHFYAARSVRRDGSKRKLSMHHAILGTPPAAGLEVDHINRSGLDNRRSNLRWVTHRQNLMNRAGKRGTTSQYRGVHLKDGRWHAEFRDKGQTTNLGYFDDERDAALAWDAVSRETYGEFAYLNLADGKSQ